MDPIIKSIVDITVLHYTMLNNEINTEDEEDELVEMRLATLQKRLRNRNLHVLSRVENFIEKTIANSSAKDFQSHFRITREAFEWLYNILAPELQSHRIGGRQMIDLDRQILAVLWLIATPSSYRSVANRFNMGKSSLFVSFVRVVTALNRLAPRIIKWPSGDDAVKNETKFSRMAGIKGVVGAIDGTYVPIKAPLKNPEAYINRKCFYGITLQCICDSSMSFIDCFTGYPSSVSDIRIFKNSDIYQEFISHTNNYFETDQFIIGDKAYPVTEWCIPPYIDRGNLTKRQIDFNTAHAKTRQVVERSFALLFGRFRRLKYLDMNRADLIPATIIAACVLHNVCLNYKDNLIKEYEREGQMFVLESNDNQNGHLENMARCGAQLRDRLSRNLNV